MSKNRPHIEQYMTPSPHTIGPKATLTEAHALMRSFQIRHLPVIEGGKLVGIVTMHDLHLLESLGGIDQNEVQVEEAMSDEPYVVEPETPIDEVAAVMVNHKYGSAIVAKHGEVVGVFTTIDALKAFLKLWQ